MTVMMTRADGGNSQNPDKKDSRVQDLMTTQKLALKEQETIMADVNKLKAHILKLD